MTSVLTLTTGFFSSVAGFLPQALKAKASAERHSGTKNFFNVRAFFYMQDVTVKDLGMLSAAHKRRCEAM